MTGSFTYRNATSKKLMAELGAIMENEFFSSTINMKHNSSFVIIQQQLATTNGGNRQLK